MKEVPTHRKRSGRSRSPRGGARAAARGRTAKSNAANPAACLAGGGEMGAVMRAIDWSKTPIGPVERWSPSLRMMVSFLLANRFPLLLWWGPEFCQLYNDPYRPVLGTKHPKSMGQPASQCWAEIWHIIGPLIETPFNGGPATWMDDIFLEMNRYGFVEETHFTIAYSPVPDETAPRGIGGVLATVHEITEKIVGERRMAALRDLGARSAAAKTAEEACVIVADTLANYPQDVPFALLYLLDRDGRQARLVAATGIGMGEAASPLVIELDAAALHDRPWPLAETIRGEAMVTIENLAARIAEVPPGPWSDPPMGAVVVPIRSNKAHQFAGLLVAGVSARLKLDEQYRSFFELAASQIATAIANARAYEEERRRAEALAEIDRAKTLFFSNVSHEFRTPLALMLGPLEDALADPGLPAIERQRLDVAHRNSLRLLKLVNALLDFSRIEAGRAQATYEPVDLAALTADLASNFRSACERAGLKLVVDCPPFAEPVYVDRDMWEKIVLNLLSNAFKFTFAGEIAISLRAADGQAALTVQDSGVGIPAHELPRLFERFHRIEGQQSRTYEGSGIGLALVQELVKLHGGTIRAESEVGRGTTFTIGLPLGASHLPQDRIGAERRLASTSVRADAYVQEALHWLPDEAGMPGDGAETHGVPPLPEGARVVVADDNADMRAYVRRLLGRNAEVETVADGAAALAAIRARRPDLVLTDVMMPRLDGFGLLRAIRDDPALRDLPVIMLSARAGEESRVEALGAGADDYLVKPFPARELIARVTANLELSGIRREAMAAARRSEALFAGQKDAFQAALNGAPLEVSLGILVCTAIEQTGGDARAAFYQADGDGTALHHVTGMPEAYARSVAGFAAGPESLACGLATHMGQPVMGQPVITPDVTEDPRWAPWRSLAAEHGFRGCWSFPIETSAGKFVGTFAMYFNEPRGAAPRDLELAAVLTHAAAVIISRHQEAEGRARTEHALLESEARLALELASSQRLQEISTLLIQEGNSGALYEQILEAAKELMHADMASIQMLDHRRGELRLLAWRGFAPSSATFWEWVRADSGSSCGAALASGQRAVVPDIETCGFMAGTGDLDAYRWSGIRAVQSTPLVSRSGRAVGMLSTHWREPHQASERDLRLFDVLARQAADLIERKQAEDALRDFNAALDTQVRERTRQLETAMADRRKAEAALQQAQRLEAIGQLTGGVAHDFNNLLTVVIGQAEAIIATANGDARIARMAAAAQRAAERGAQLTGQLLAFARRQQLRPVVMSIEPLLTNIGEIVRRTVGETIAVEVGIDPGLWPSSLDPAQFESAILNLAINARDAMPEGGRLAIDARNTPVAAAEAERLDLAAGDYVTVGVTDTGAGMAPEVLRRAFEPFFTTKDVGKGTGLGLAQIYGFVKQSGGTAAIDSALGRGTTVTLYFPRVDDSVAKDKAPVLDAAPVQGRGRTVLLVEDQADVRDVIEMALADLGFRILTAPDGLAAREVLASDEPIDLLLTDVVMPKGVSGLDLAQEARRLRQDIKILLVSGYLRDNSSQMAALPGLFLLEKPFNQAELAASVAAALGGRELPGGGGTILAGKTSPK